MNRLIDEALDIKSRIEEGKYIYTDDAPFEIPRIDGAHLLELNVDIRHSTLNPHKLIKNERYCSDTDRRDGACTLAANSRDK